VQITNVSLLLANNELYQSKGNVEVIESEFNETGNVAFRAVPSKLLKHGRFCANACSKKTLL
jgi:membrane fusion protein (multidrug efflux system)